jgi:hypothetical protein
LQVCCDAPPPLKFSNCSTPPFSATVKRFTETPLAPPFTRCIPKDASRSVRRKKSVVAINTILLRKLLCQ